MAVKILDKYYKRVNGDIVKAVIWRVEKSEKFPAGVKYSFVYIHNGKRVLGYDNERAKGDHKHIYHKGIEIEKKIKVTNIFKLFQKFEMEVNLLIKRYGG